MRALPYLDHLQLNIKLYYLYKLLSNFVFLYAIWYTFESQYLSVFMLGVVYALARFVITLLELPTGALADLLGRKHTLSLGMIIEGMSWIMLGLWPSAGMIFAAYLLNSIGTSLVSGADSALLFDTLKELKREKEFTVITSKANLLMRITMFAGAILGGYLFAWQQGSPYIFFGVSLALGGCIAYLSREPKIDTETFTLKNYLRQTKTGILELTRSPFMKVFSLFYMVVGGITWYHLYFLHTALLTAAIPSDVIRGWAIALASGVAGLALFGAARFMASDNHRFVIVMFSSLLLLLTLPALLFSDQMLIIVSVGMYFLGIARFSFLDQIANDHFRSQYRATALSALNMGVSIVFIIWSVAGGWIIDHWGMQMLLTVLGIFFVVTGLPSAYVLLHRHTLG